MQNSQVYGQPRLLKTATELNPKRRPRRNPAVTMSEMLARQPIASYAGIGVITAPRTSSPGSYQDSFEDSCYAAAHGGRWPRSGNGGVLW